MLEDWMAGRSVLINSELFNQKQGPGTGVLRVVNSPEEAACNT